MRLLAMSALAFAAAASTAWAGDQSFEDFFGYYFHRTDTIAVGAGNAKDVNAVSQTVDPWPPYVRNRSIPANGARMTGAIQRYEDVKKLKDAAPTLPPDAINPVGLGNPLASR